VRQKEHHKQKVLEVLNSMFTIHKQISKMVLKKTFAIVAIAILSYIPYSCDAAEAWKIISSTPKDKKVNVHVGEQIRLMVTANNYIRKCVWIHTESNKACEFRYTHAVNKLVKQNTCLLDDHEGRIHVAGNYDKHECGLKISQAILNDTGEWRVEVKEYIDKNPITFFTANPAKDNRKFQIKVTEKIVTKPPTKKPLTTLAPLLDTRIQKSDNTVVLSPLNAGNTNENNESNSSLVFGIIGGICGILALLAVIAFVAYRYRKLYLATRNPSVKFSDVYPREDDDDKTWRGDDSWRVNADQNIYSEPPGNQDSQNPLDDDIGITNPRNEKALEKMGELHSVTYSGSKRIL